MNDRIIPKHNHRCIMHLDMDAFFASVEIVKNPRLKGKPIIVGGNPDKRGVVSTCSYEAREFGVHSAMSLYEAKKRCPHAIFIEGDYSHYREYSDAVMSILSGFTPFVEVVSIDEAYFDVSHIVFNDEESLALGRRIKDSIFNQTKLTCSVGIGSNKLIAKIAAALSKPNGLKVVSVGQESAFLAPLSIQTLPGVGTKTQEALNREGIMTVADLQAIDLEELIQRYGSHGYHFHLVAYGKDSRPVESEDQPPKSIGAEMTFEVDQDDVEHLRESLTELLDRAHRRLCRHKMRAKGIHLKLRYSDFRTITRSKTFDGHTNEREKLLQGLFYLFNKSYDGKEPLRLVGMTFEKLTDTYWQPDFFQ